MAAATARINSLCPRISELLVDNDFCRDASSKKSQYVTSMAAATARINSLCPRISESSGMVDDDDVVALFLLLPPAVQSTEAWHDVALTTVSRHHCAYVIVFLVSGSVAF